MPRDKSITHEKVIRAMREEFLTHGYEKASLNRISAKVGITTAGLYRHFRNKEDMFAYLVQDTVNAFHAMAARSENQMETDLDYDPFNEDWATFWSSFIAEHAEGLKLLLCRSQGSRFETFEEELIALEVEGNKTYATALEKAGKKVRLVSDLEWHTLAATYVHLVVEAVRRDMTLEETQEHLRFVGRLLYPGWKQLFAIE